jgi:hypothetical protein
MKSIYTSITGKNKTSKILLISAFQKTHPKLQIVAVDGFTNPIENSLENSNEKQIIRKFVIR